MSPILEVLIGLVFIFSLLSILVTQINAIIAQTLRLRSNYLFDTVKNMIHDRELTARFVTHPLIKLIDFSDVEGMEKWSVISPSQELTKEQAEQILSSALSGAEWINPTTFSNVLLNLISVSEDRQLFIVLDDIAQQMDNEANRRDIRRKINSVVETGLGIDELVNAINSLPASAHKKALVDRLRDISKQIGDKGLKTDINVSVMAGVQYIKDQYLKNAINTILTTSKTLDEVEQKITKWFDDTNYKASEMFKRDMKYYSYLIGLVIAIVLNVDTIFIAQKLWEDPVLRSAVAETARSANISDMEETNNDAIAAINSNESSTLTEVTDGIAVGRNTLSQIQDTRIPIGWVFEDLSYIVEDPNQHADDIYKLNDSRYIWNLVSGQNPNFTFLVSVKIIGILATMLAIGQGAPFWFNILKQIR